jgi:hypothetical protein
MAEVDKSSGEMTGARTFLTVLLIAVIALSCVACGSSGAESGPEALHEAKGGLQRCPERALGRRDNENPLAKKTLVPPGAWSALICRYQGRRTAGPAPPPQAEVLHASSRRFQRLLSAFEQLKPARRGAVACPTGKPLRYLVAFHYRSQSDDYVRVDFNGCGLVTNDTFRKLFYPSGRLRRILG